VLRTPVRAKSSAVGPTLVAEFAAQYNLFATPVDRATNQGFIMSIAISVRSVEHINPLADSVMDRGYRFFVV
jgi:hypothetical protein